MSSNLTRFSGWTFRHFRMNKLLRTNFHTSNLIKQKLTIVDKEVQENKMDIMTHIMSQNISYTPQISEKITKLLFLFPFSQAAVKSVLMKHPHLLKQDPQRIYSLTTILVELSDYEGITQEDALCFVGGCPDVFRMSSEDFRHTISTLFSETIGNEIPWNVIMRQAPQTLLVEPKLINRYLTFFSDELGANNVCHVMGNNPGIVGMDIEEIRETISFLYDTMGVSPFRITRSSELLSVSLDFLKLRYEFILRCGHYRHPDPKSKGARPLEASPSPNIVLEPSVERFVAKATPGVTMEEFYVFTALFEEENSDKSHDFHDDDFEDAEEEKEFKESFKGKRKTPRDPETNKGRKRIIAGKKKYNY